MPWISELLALQETWPEVPHQVCPCCTARCLDRFFRRYSGENSDSHTRARDPFVRCAQITKAQDINAGVMLSRWRAEMAAVSGVNERTMGVASMASRCPEHASHTAPGERDGAVLHVLTR